MDEMIITKPEFYFHTQKISLEQRIKILKLNEVEEDAIVTSKTIKIIRDKVLGLF